MFRTQFAIRSPSFPFPIRVWDYPNKQTRRHPAGQAGAFFGSVATLPMLATVSFVPHYYYGEHPAFFQTYKKKFKNNSRRILEKLRIFVYNIFCIIVSIRKERRMKGYLSIRETSYKWGISERRVNQYISQGRIPGAERFGRSWAIPEDAKKPSDPRKADTNKTSRR